MKQKSPECDKNSKQIWQIIMLSTWWLMNIFEQLLGGKKSFSFQKFDFNFRILTLILEFWGFCQNFGKKVEILKKKKPLVHLAKCKKIEISPIKIIVSHPLDKIISGYMWTTIISRILDFITSSISNQLKIHMSYDLNLLTQVEKTKKLKDFLKLQHRFKSLICDCNMIFSPLFKFPTKPL